MPKKHKKKTQPTKPKIFGLPEPKWLQKITLPNWMLLALALIFIFRIPSFFEPYYYGDEMIYMAVGQGLSRGMVLYRDIFDHKTPLIYYLAMIAGSIFWFKVILAGWMIATTIAFYKLVSHFFPKKIAVVQASVASFAILTTLPLLEGNIVNAELLMIGPVILAFYLLLSKKHTPLLLLKAGLLFAIGALFKVPSIFEFGVIIVFWLMFVKVKKSSLLKLILDTATIVVGIAIPFLVFGLWFAIRGALSDFLFATFTINFGYITAWGQPVAATTNGFSPLLTRAILVLVGIGILFIFRKRLSKQFVFATIWLLVTLFAATLSGRPYPHYLIQIVPAASILIGMLIAFPSLDQSLTIIPLLLVVLTVTHFGYWYYPTGSYYNNFFHFALQRENKWDYYKEFSANTKRNYDLASFLLSTTKPNDTVFVWGDSPVIYTLSHRLPNIKYITDFHINDFSSPQKEFSSLEKKAEFVVILPEAKYNRFLRSALKRHYILFDTVEGAKIYKTIKYLTIK